MVYLNNSTKKCVGKMFSDLAKGFDCISHEVLVDKLHLYGTCIYFFGEGGGKQSGFDADT
jgi:hypothetical protein